MSGNCIKGYRSPLTIEEKIELVRKRMFQELGYYDCLKVAQVSQGTFSIWMNKYKPEVLRRLSTKDLPLYVTDKHKIPMKTSK